MTKQNIHLTVEQAIDALHAWSIYQSADTHHAPELYEFLNEEFQINLKPDTSDKALQEFVNSYIKDENTL